MSKKLAFYPTVLGVALVICSCTIDAQETKRTSPTKLTSPESERNDVGKPDKQAGQKSKNDDQSKSEKGKKKQPPFAWVNPLPKGHHPALKHATFRSSSRGVDVGYCILLPAGYVQAEATRFPVVYYLHGGRPGSEAKSHKLAELIYDVIEAGDVAPMIYVFVNGGPVSHYNMPDDPTAQGADVFVRELIPHIDATYRTIANRTGRGLEGFSQGGRGTMRLSLRHPDLFCSAAAGGGGYATEKVISQSDGYESDNLKFALGDNTWDLARKYVASKSPMVSWMIYVGTDGFNYQNNLEYMKFLDSLGIKHQSVVVPDQPHSAIKIYEQAGRRIMRFHAANFVRAATLDTIDTPRGAAIRKR